ncbi:MAG: hypothetical protein J5472_05700 [Clostridia bacterium]|nr:hypothetical protein [Clostridia bacterium]
MKKLLVILLLLMLCGCGSQETKAAAPEKSPLQTAYEEGKAFELVKAELPAEGVALGGMPVALSPDGKTYLWRTKDALYVVRDGQALPVKAAPERGVGDPFGTLEETVSMLPRIIPGYEGVSWSPDGRYALMTNARYAVKMAGHTSMNLTLLDTETGEAFLAAAYGAEFKSDDYGMALQAAFDRTEKYIYYFDMTRKREGASPYALKRCDLDGFRSETLSTDYYPSSRASLTQKQDGNWLAVGSCEESRGMRDVLRLYAADSGKTLQRTDLPLEGKWSLLKLNFSADTGYGLGYGYSQTAMQASGAASAANAAEQLVPVRAVEPILMFVQTMRLLRVTPEGIDTAHYWYLRSDSEDGAEVRAVQMEDEAVAWLTDVVKSRELSYADEEQKARLTAYAEEMDSAVIMSVMSFCLSPDGHYALLSASGGKQHRGLNLYRLYLMNLETMEVRPVAVPEGLAGLELYFSTAYSQDYPPCMEWNADGTLLIYDANSHGVQAWHLVWQ